MTSRALRLVALFWALRALPLFAHDPGLSTANIRLQRDALDIALVLSVRDAGQLVNLDPNGDGQSTPRELRAAESALAAKVMEYLEFRIDDRSVAIARAKCSFDKSGNVTLRLVVPGRPEAGFKMRSSIIALLPAGHRQFLSVEDAKGRLLAERLLSANCDSATIHLEPAGIGSGDSSFLDFLGLGFKHILGGYDHLLFLIALVLATATVWDLVKVVSAFTLAHTITLTLSVLNFVRLPSNFVEPMIAGSIVIVALTNVFYPKRSRGRVRLVTAFLFGLFHGLGFAGGLLSVTQGTAALAVFMAIAAFSLGVELGHQMIVLPLFCGLRLVRSACADDAGRERFAAVALRAGSLLISVAGGFYLIAALR